jgi:hypothetical protein
MPLRPLVLLRLLALLILTAGCDRAVSPAPAPAALVYRITRVSGWYSQYRDSILATSTRAWYYGGDSTQRRGVWTTPISGVELAELFRYVAIVDSTERERRQLLAARASSGCNPRADVSNGLPLCPRGEVAICEMGPAISYTLFRPLPAKSYYTNCFTTDSTLRARLATLLSHPTWAPLFPTR